MVIIYRRQRAEIKQGLEAAESRHWSGPEEAPPGPRGFLANPKSLQAPSCFDNPLKPGPGERAAGLFSIREDAQEVQRNASNYSTTSRDCLLPSGTAHAGDASPQHRPGRSTHQSDLTCTPLPFTLSGQSLNPSRAQGTAFFARALEQDNVHLRPRLTAL